METITQKITRLKTTGYELTFEEVFNKAFENYKKIAIYAGFAILFFAVVIALIAFVGAIVFFGTEQLNENLLTNLKKDNLPIEFIGYQFVVIILATSFLSPISAGFLKMAEAGEKDVEFKMRDFLVFYKDSCFKELFLATFIIIFLSQGIESIFSIYKIPFIGTVLSFLVGIFAHLTIPLIVFGKQKAIPALQASISITSKQLFVIILLLVVALLGSYVGLIGLCIGVLFTLPFNISMQYAIYDSIIGTQEEEAVTIETEEN